MADKPKPNDPFALPPDKKPAAVPPPPPPPPPPPKTVSSQKTVADNTAAFQPTVLDAKTAKRRNTNFAFDETIPSRPGTFSSQPTQLERTVLSATSFDTAVDTQDLTSEKMLMPASRGKFGDLNVPMLGGVALLSKLGQGGMGAVYMGRNPADNREVAVKVLPFHMAERDPVLIDRFFREAAIAMKIKSPNLVSVFDAKEEQGLCYILMEYVSGMSAGSYLKKVKPSGIDEAEALEICIAATQGLIAAHKENIIHRDIKPDNILVPQDAATNKLNFTASKLADLGLARSEEHGNSLTGSQASMGTPGYMSPEQAMDARKCGKPADIFSMGACLYALVSGRPPFHGRAPMELIMMTVKEKHEPLASIRPNISGPTSTLVERCLNKDPQFRFKDAETLLNGLKLCRKVLGKTPAEQAKAIEELRGKQPKEASKEQPYFNDLTIEASAKPRRPEVELLEAENALRNQKVASKLPIVAAVILAGFFGAGITMFIQAPSKPERVAEAPPAKVIEEKPKPKPAPPPVEDIDDGRPKRKLSREMEIMREHDERMEKMMKKVDQQFEKAKVVEPILPVSSVNAAYEDESYFSVGRVMLGFICSVLGMAYALYSRKNGNLVFGLCGVVLMLGSWGLPSLPLAVMLSGVAISVPLFTYKG